MKTLLLISPTPPPYSGMERATQLLLECRIAKEFDIVFVNSNAKAKGSEARGKISLGKILPFLKQLLRIMYLSLFKRPDVALTPLAQNKAGFIKCGLFILTAALFGVPVVTWMGGSAFGEFYKKQSRPFQFFIRLCLNRISRIIIRGKGQAEQFDGLFPKDKLPVVYNPRLTPTDNFQHRCISTSPTRILYMALISKAKGALDALEAVGILKQQGIDISATLGGDIIEVEKNIMHVDSPESTSSSIKKLMDTYSLHDTVTFPGFLENEAKNDAYKNHDIFIFPSYSEGAPFSILESIANGIPIVATPVGNLPELLQDEKDILYCEFGNPASLAEKIRKLIENPELLHQLPQNADQSLLQKCSLESFENSMIEILSKASR